MEDFFIYRPSLARKVSAQGFKLEMIANIYDSDRPAWKCKLSRPAASVIAEYFLSIGKDVPRNVKDVLNQVTSN